MTCSSSLSGFVKALGQVLILLVCIAFFCVLLVWIFRASSGQAMEPQQHQMLLVLLLILGGPICYFFATHQDKFEIKWMGGLFTLGGGYAVSFAAVFLVTKFIYPITPLLTQNSVRLVQFDYGPYADIVKYYACQPDNTVRRVQDPSGKSGVESEGPEQYFCIFSSRDPITIKFTIHRGNLTPIRHTVQISYEGTWGEVITLSKDIKTIVQTTSYP